MDDIFSQLTNEEIKIITLFEFSADLTNESQRKKLRSMISSKRYFSSEKGITYENAFIEYSNTGKSPVTCSFCDDVLSESDLLICSKCKASIENAAKEIASNPEDTAQKRKKHKKIKAKKVKKEKKVRESKNNSENKNGIGRLFLGILIGIVIALIGVAGFLIWIKLSSVRAIKRADISDVSKAFETNITEYGYSIGECTIADNGSLVYELLPKHDAFIVYPDDDNKLEGASLVMSGSDDQSKTRQMMLISLLNMTIYTDEDTNAMMDLLSKMIESGGEYEYRGYKWNLVPTDDATYYFVVADEGNIINDTYVPSSTDSDLSFLIGLDYSVAEQILGESVPIIAENTRYYEKSGISIVYDTQSGMIIYIDQDGTGTDGAKYGLCGAYIGMDREMISRVFAEHGFDAGNAEDEFWAGTFEQDDITRELSVEFENDKVVLVCLKVVN